MTATHRSLAPPRPRPPACASQRTIVALAAACALLRSLGAPTPASADLVDPTDFVESTWLSAPGDVTGMAFAPDGSNRLFLSRKGGQVRIVQMLPGGGASLLTTPFVTVSPVFTNSECGLIGMAFDPDFVSNGYVYLFVTVSSTEQQIIRYTESGGVGMDKTVVVAELPTRGQNHDGGGLGFGPDGMLYWSIGDLGNGTGVDADLSSLAAKVGRARRDGSLPGDNPFVDGPGSNNDFIFARGLRNPFTLTFQPTTGLLWVNVVGTNAEQIFVVRAGDHAGYNDYENDQPAGFITPVIAYRTGGLRTLNLEPDGAVRDAGVTTFTTTAQHRLRQGERIVVTGVGDASFDGTFYVLRGSSTPTDRTFTVRNAGPDASSGGGQLSTMAQGRTVSGGTFYDATGFPESYRGNFFYGDFIDDRMMRAVVGPGTTVNSVDYWSNNISAPIDQAVGPDGALYTASYGGTVYRTAYTNPVQALVVSQQHVRVLEGGAAVFSVSLARAPSGNVTVTTARTSGDTDVSVAGGATLTFTPANWMDPQAVRVAAAADADGEPDLASLTVSASTLSDVSVLVDVTDSTTLVLLLSRTSVAIPEGASRSFTVRLADAPPGPVTVTVSRTAGDTDITVAAGATLTFTPADYATPQLVTLAAAEDADALDDSATFAVGALGAATLEVSANAVDNDRANLDAGPDTDMGAAADSGALGDSGVLGDAGGVDAGRSPGGGGGCGCRVAPARSPAVASGRSAPYAALVPVLALLGWLTQRSRRRARARALTGVRASRQA
ncbi:MAG: PQQ-dependent sugar dehydrogenase [Myxococcales bacterium]|nr:PQQ-dependent sugar dehydrogenase [Myxococcales bacterium]